MRIVNLPGETADREARCGDAVKNSLLVAATAGATKRMCAGCEVSAECLEYALLHDDRFGIRRAGSNEGRRHTG